MTPEELDAIQARAETARTHAREDVPALIAEVRRLRTEVSALLDKCDRAEAAERTDGAT